MRQIHSVTSKLNALQTRARAPGAYQHRTFNHRIYVPPQFTPEVTLTWSSDLWLIKIYNTYLCTNQA